MERDPRDANQGNTDNQLRKIDDTYIFDSASGIYKPKTYSSEANTHSNPQRIAWKSPIRVKFPRDWIAITIAILTLWVVSKYTYYAGLQWVETKNAAQAAANAVTLSRENAHLDQRAWIGVDGIAGLPKIDDPLTVDITLKNTGKTPAKNASFLTSFRPVRKGEVLTYGSAKPKTEISKAMIPPNALYHASTPPTPKMNSFDLDRIADKTVIVYVYGDGTYDDIFACTHWLQFCYYLTPDAKGWAACKHHNDTGDKTPCPETGKK